MEALQYRPRRANAGTRGTATVALLVLSTHEMFHHVSTSTLTMEGIHKELARLGVNLVVANATTPEEIPPVVLRRQVKGLILQGQYPNPAVLEKIKGIPAVWLTSHHGVKGDALLPGNEQVGRIAANYLHEKGCRVPGVLNAMTWNPAITTRVQFFSYTMEQLGHRPPRRYLAGHDERREIDDAFKSDLHEFDPIVRELVGRMLADPDRTDGLFVPFDLQTAIVHRELLRHGVQPGRDILLIGSDEIQAALIGLWPRPATISLRSMVVGQIAVQQLMHRIANPDGEGDVQVSIQPTLIPGEDWADVQPRKQPT